MTRPDDECVIRIEASLVEIEYPERSVTGFSGFPI